MKWTLFSKIPKYLIIYISTTVFPRSQKSLLGSEVDSVASEAQNQQQRVADWIRSNVDEPDVSSSDNSRSENADGIDRARYAEMEENVKRFLFGESDFLKTVEIGKNKYRRFVETEIDGSTTGAVENI